VEKIEKQGGKLQANTDPGRKSRIVSSRRIPCWAILPQVHFSLNRSWLQIPLALIVPEQLFRPGSDQ